MATLLSLTVFHITFRVAEPEGLARRLRFSANGVTDQGLGERNDSDWSRQRGVIRRPA
jgi:hypothetical protein